MSGAEEGELDDYMSGLFNDDIAALREMQQADSKTQFLQATEAVRAQRGGSSSAQARAVWRVSGDGVLSRLALDGSRASDAQRLRVAPGRYVVESGLDPDNGEPLRAPVEVRAGASAD